MPPDWKPHTQRFTVLARGTGSYWSLRVSVPEKSGTHLWVDCAAWMQMGELKYIGLAAPEEKARLGLK